MQLFGNMESILQSNPPVCLPVISKTNRPFDPPTNLVNGYSFTQSSLVSHGPFHTHMARSF